MLLKLSYSLFPNVLAFKCLIDWDMSLQETFVKNNPYKIAQDPFPLSPTPCTITGLDSELQALLI